MEVITPMLYCSKCHALYENGTTCSNCNEPLTEPKPGNLVLLTAAMYAESNEILDAFRARGIYIDRKPTIEEGVFELSYNMQIGKRQMKRYILYWKI